MFRKIILKLGMSWAGRELRAIAEGKRGTGPQGVYLFLQGKKTLIGVLLAVTAAVLVSLGHDVSGAGVGAIASFLISVGLADKAWRTRPATFEGHALWRFVRDVWPDVVVLVGAATAALTECDPELVAMLGKVGLTCSSALAVLTGAVAGLSWLVGEAKLAPPPKE
jgi:hypothetical protein